MEPRATATVTVTLAPATVKPGDELTLSWSVPAGHPYDWVGLCPLTTPLDLVIAPVARVYTAGGRTGTARWHAPVTPGAYVGVYVHDNGTVVAGQSTALTVEGPPPPPVPVVTLTVAPVTLEPGFPVTVTWDVPPDIVTPDDWLGLYHPGAANDEHLQWFYTDGELVGRNHFTLHDAGAYEVRYLTNNDFTDIARSALITVTAPQDAEGDV